MARPWKVTGREIEALWTEIWPKIVAIAWLDEASGPPGQAAYRRGIERNASFRYNEVKRIADILTRHGLLRLNWSATIPICVAAPRAFGIIMGEYSKAIRNLKPMITTETDDEEDAHLDSAAEEEKRHLESTGAEEDRPLESAGAEEDRPQEPAGAEEEESDTGKSQKTSCPDTLYGETFFYINQKGILLPFPETPDRKEIFIGYTEGGGALPRIPPHGGPPWAGSSLTPTEGDLYTELTNVLPVTVDDPWRCRPIGLSGIALLTLFEKWAEVVGGAWNHPTTVPNDIRNHLQAYIKPEVWSVWPPYLEATASNAQHDFVIEGDADKDERDDHIKMKVPVPDPPAIPLPTREEIFKELIVGGATNPMYSNCY